MTRAKPIVEEENAKCPYCGSGDINIKRTLDWYSSHRAHAAGRSALIPQYHPEKLEIQNQCSVCKKSKKEIKEALEKGKKKPATKEERIKRLEAMGIPTKIEM